MKLLATLDKTVGGKRRTIDIGGDDIGTGLLVAGEVSPREKALVLRSLLSSLADGRSAEELEIHAFGRQSFLKSLPALPHVKRKKVTDKPTMETMYFFAPEMEYRQGRFAREGVQGIDAYNAKSNDRLPAIVMVIDADDRTAAFPFIEGMRPALQNARAAGIFAVFVSRSAVEDFSVTSFLTAAFTPWSVLRLTPRRKAGKGTVATLVHLAGAVLLVRHDGRGRRRFARFAGDRIEWTADEGRATALPDMAEEDALGSPLKESFFPAGITLRRTLRVVRHDRLDTAKHAKKSTVPKTGLQGAEKQVCNGHRTCTRAR